MKKSTHLLMGAAVTVPVAAALSPVGALGCVWLGIVGGSLPDYLDFHSDVRRTLKHRGISHSLLVALGTGIFAWLVFDALSRAEYDIFPVPARFVAPWSVSIALGMVSHVLGDACTRGGVQPLLPLSRKRMWILPRFLRGRSDGKVNFLAKGISLALIGAGIAAFALRM